MKPGRNKQRCQDLPFRSGTMYESGNQTFLLVSSLASSNSQLLRFLHDQGQKREQKIHQSPTLLSFITITLYCYSFTVDKAC